MCYAKFYSSTPPPITRPQTDNDFGAYLDRPSKAIEKNAVMFGDNMFALADNNFADGVFPFSFENPPALGSLAIRA